MLSNYLELLILAFINSLFIVAIWRAAHFEYLITDAEYANPPLDWEATGVLGPIHEYFQNRWWTKPVFSCLACMASVHSLYVFWPVMWFVYGFHVEHIYVYLVYIPVVSAMNVLINRFSE